MSNATNQLLSLKPSYRKFTNYIAPRQKDKKLEVKVQMFQP
jgi:hypothetical protein